MEQSMIWKNFLILIIGSLIALHVNMAGAAVDESSPSGSHQDDGCVLTDE
jgi:hypothetical protein